MKSCSMKGERDALLLEGNDPTPQRGEKKEKKKR